VRLAFGTALAEDFKAALVAGADRDGQSLGEKIVAGVAGGDFDLIGFAAEAHDVMGEDDFSFWHRRKGDS